MSDSDNDPAVEPPVAVVKAKRVLSVEQLEKLKYARIKAGEKKQELSNLKAREKALKDKLLTDRIAALDLAEAKPSTRSRKKHRHRRRAQTSSSSSSSSSSSDSDSEPEVKVRKSKKKSVRKVPTTTPVDQVKDDALAASIVRDELQKRMMKQTYQHAFASLFPGKANIYD